MNENEKRVYPDNVADLLNLILSVGSDYDGCRSSEALMNLVDELLSIARKAKQCLYSDNIFPKSENDDECVLEYISRQDVLDALAENHKSLMDDPELSAKTKWREALCYHRVVKSIEAVPMQNVIEMKTGYWELCGTFDDFARCSCCKTKKYPIEQAQELSYCPDCGAAMIPFGEFNL